MSIKIFLPSKYFYIKQDADIYGEIQINENNTISYFIISVYEKNNKMIDNHLQNRENLRLLGRIMNSNASVMERKKDDVALSFTYDNETSHIYLVAMSIQMPDITFTTVVLYDEMELIKIHRNNYIIDDGNCSKIDQLDDIDMLLILVKQKQCYEENKKIRFQLFVSRFLSFPLSLCFNIFRIVFQCNLSKYFENSTLGLHYHEWKQFRDSRKRALNLTLDKCLGILLMIIIIWIIPHPGDTLLNISHLVIKEVRYLLSSLKGSPVGLKLNAHLNEFLLDCFNYHVNLWAAFLNLIEPLVRQLFVPIGLVGIMGITFQIALLQDLIAVISLHAHCFYIYSAVLYKVEIKGIQVFWKVVRGKRFNVLKCRIESYSYSYRQQFLATIFFSSLLFLFPTVVVYYVVFTVLRLCLSFVYYLLRSLRRQILEFPLHIFLKFISSNFYEKESLQLQHISHEQSPILQSRCFHMSVFKINVQTSSLSRVLNCSSGVLQKLTANEKFSLKSIMNLILEGKF